MSIRTYYTTNTQIDNKVTNYNYVCSSEMNACYLIMLIMMFIHNMYNTFKVSVQFIIKNALILVDCYYVLYLVFLTMDNHVSET